MINNAGLSPKERLAHVKRREITPADWRRKATFLHSLHTCCLSGRNQIELSHLHEGSFKLGRKVSNVLVLPMNYILHKAQHRDPGFWAKALPGHDPKEWAVRLDKICQDNDPEAAEALLQHMQANANRGYMTGLFMAEV